MLGVFIVLFRGQWRRLGDVDCCSGDIVRVPFRGLGIGGVWLDTLAGGGSGVKESVGRSDAFGLRLRLRLEVSSCWSRDTANAECWTNGREESSGSAGEHGLVVEGE